MHSRFKQFSYKKKNYMISYCYLIQFYSYYFSLSIQYRISIQSIHSTNSINIRNVSAKHDEFSCKNVKLKTEISSNSKNKRK